MYLWNFMGNVFKNFIWSNIITIKPVCSILNDPYPCTCPPFAPGKPGGPLRPGPPWGPSTPGLPENPGSPLSPLEPRGPSGAIPSPRSPFSPGIPFAPGYPPRPCIKVHTCTVSCVVSINYPDTVM